MEVKAGNDFFDIVDRYGVVLGLPRPGVVAQAEGIKAPPLALVSHGSLDARVPQSLPVGGQVVETRPPAQGGQALQSANRQAGAQGRVGMGQRVVVDPVGIRARSRCS